MVRSLIDAKTFIGQLAFEKVIEKDDSVNAILERDNTDFWIKLDLIDSIISPIAAKIGLVESDKACLSDIPIIFNYLAALLTTISSECNLDLNTVSGTIQRKLAYIYIYIYQLTDD